MKCPFCGHGENSVVDSRLGRDSVVIRRRRECEACKKRFTTYERIEELLPNVVKKDGRREPFDRMKVISGVKKACEKRPVSLETIELLVDQVEHRLQEAGEAEVPSTRVGEEVMKQLVKLDQVAYVRFASVYRQFKDIGEFMSELEGLAGKA
ncbi:MAG: transcriptional repressor NrdR [Deltaproteobacteria bacterium]|nr:transcriptional repressor NrdR [Deltaproteobacteria bacterium]